MTAREPFCEANLILRGSQGIVETQMTIRWIAGNRSLNDEDLVRGIRNRKASRHAAQQVLHRYVCRSRRVPDYQNGRDGTKRADTGRKIPAA